MLDRPSRFAALAGDMKIPPSHLYPDWPVPTLWRVTLAVDGKPVDWRGYAGTSTGATQRAIDWCLDSLPPGAAHPAIRVLEVLQVGT